MGLHEKGTVGHRPLYITDIIDRFPLAVRRELPLFFTHEVSEETPLADKNPTFEMVRNAINFVDHIYKQAPQHLDETRQEECVLACLYRIIMGTQFSEQELYGYEKNVFADSLARRMLHARNGTFIPRYVGAEAAEGSEKRRSWGFYLERMRQMIAEDKPIVTCADVAWSVFEPEMEAARILGKTGKPKTQQIVKRVLDTLHRLKDALPPNSPEHLLVVSILAQIKDNKKKSKK